jgi:ribosomal protein S18 acetylase RimI-like enzyme
MKVRELNRGDLALLSEFVKEAYRDYPLATWFDEEPSAGQMESIFSSKLRSIESRALVDVVTEDNGRIAGECEVARIGSDSGVIGILVRHGYRGRSVGSEMLTEAIDDAVDMGVTKFSAEVDERNADALRFFADNGFVPGGYRNIERGGKTHRIVILHHSIV